MLIRLGKYIFICFICLLRLIAITNYVRAEPEEDGIKKFIEAYFNVQYQSLSSLKEEDIREFYFVETSEGEKSYIIDKEVLSFIIGCRGMQENDLRLKSYNFELDYKVFEVSEDSANIVLLENSEFQFKFLKNTTSRKYNVEHKFKLKKINNSWKIVNHDSSEDEFKIIRDGIKEFRSYEGIKEFYLDMMRRNKDVKKHYIRERKSDEDELKKERKDSLQSSNNNVNNLNYYDREKAVSYAKRWAENGKQLRNSPPWGNYDQPQGDGDCTNFVSQCIHAGGIPMDYRGKEYEQWKWYGDEYNSAQSKKGRVASWTGVKALYNYCKLNKGFGISAEVDSTWNDVHIGDIIQFGKSEDDYFHSVIITQYVYDENDILIDFLICCHTTDRHNYPLSAYSYPLKRYIHIKGWSS